jgi:hypothetical protein
MGLVLRHPDALVTRDGPAPIARALRWFDRGVITRRRRGRLRRAVDGLAGLGFGLVAIHIVLRFWDLPETRWLFAFGFAFLPLSSALAALDDYGGGRLTLRRLKGAVIGLAFFLVFLAIALSTILHGGLPMLGGTVCAALVVPLLLMVFVHRADAALAGASRPRDGRA